MSNEFPPSGQPGADRPGAVPPVPPVNPAPVHQASSPSQKPTADAWAAAASSAQQLSAEPVVDLQDPHLESELSDGEWHRMHPLTPLLQGGIVLIVLFGIIISNMQDRIVGIFIPKARIDEYTAEYNGDPIDWVLANNLLLVALGVVALILVIVIGAFYASWRVHKFRITEANVEVQKGILFRSHRRAPLDRVQGVNLTRPFIARLIGLAKLEVVGAGNDANVPLEYLTTKNAEEVRADILRLASGARLARQARISGTTLEQQRQHLLDKVGEGITGIVSGAERPVGEPASVVKIPTKRLVGSTLLSSNVLGLVVLVIGIIVVSTLATQPWGLFSLIPAGIALGGVTVSQFLKSMNYSIAPTPDGVRVTFGLTTTVTEILPPGRIHALSVGQSFLWRPLGWYRVRLIRMSGKNANQGQVDQFSVVLPVGKREDVEKVLALLMPDVARSDWAYAFEHGMLGPKQGDPFTVTPKRAWFIRPFSFKRNGYLLHPLALMLRRGKLWRSLAIFPLARSQSLKMSQGPIDRLARVGELHIHTVVGQFNGALAAVDRDNLQNLWTQTEQAIVAAESADRTHRWGASEGPA